MLEMVPSDTTNNDKACCALYIKVICRRQKLDPQMNGSPSVAGYREVCS